MHSPKVLLVESDSPVREALSFSLGLEEFEVTALASPEAVLDDPMPAAGSDCLVIDYQLDGMDGLALRGELRAMGVAAPAVLIASAPSRAVLARAVEAGAVLIEMPLLCDALAAAIRRELGARSVPA